MTACDVVRKEMLRHRRAERAAAENDDVEGARIGSRIEPPELGPRIRICAQLGLVETIGHIAPKNVLRKCGRLSEFRRRHHVLPNTKAIYAPGLKRKRTHDS